MVKFVDTAVTKTAKTPRKAQKVNSRFSLNIEGNKLGGSITTTTIEESLASMDEGNFVILEKTPEDYIQSTIIDGTYVLERRDGDATRHFVVDIGEALTLEQIQSAFIAYATERALPQALTWKPLRLG